jgi:Tol biopolymer transport system component
MSKSLPVVALLCFLAALLGCTLSATKPQTPPGYQQLTSSTGEAGSPRLSPDGKYVAYVSDQADAGNFDIWIQSVEQGQPVRLTNDPARDYDPVFSEDGKNVYFTSLREPSGIYRVAASGGDASLVVQGGLAPEVSPDGQALVFVSSSGTLALLDLRDQSTRPLFQDFYSSYAPKWSPDSKEILFAGKVSNDDEVEWWIGRPANSSAPRNTGLLSALRQRGFNEAYAQAWLPGDNLVFAGKRGDTETLWNFKLSADRGIATNPVRTTDDDSGDYRASYAAGRLAFERTRAVLNLWSLPVNVNQGRATGKAQRLTSTDGQKGCATMSHDGRTLLYSADQLGTYRLVLKDLTNGRERIVGVPGAFYPVLSRDGSRYAYGIGSKGMVNVSTRTVSGWRSWWSQSICDRCGMPRGFSADGKFLLLWSDAEPENHIDLLDLATGKPRTVLRHGIYHFYNPELSSDGAWISFSAKTGEHSFRTFIARIPTEGTVSESEWIGINPSSSDYEMAFWSPDGNLLYLLADHGEGNLTFLDAQRLDPQSKQPSGELFSVYHFAPPRVPTMDPIWNHPAAVEGRIVLELADMSTNVWIKQTAH